MATKKTTIGRTPTFAGAWVNNYVNPKTGHNGYPLKKRVSHLGSEFQSLIEDNTYVPATLNQAHTEITFDTEHWEVVSNGSDAYLLQYTVENKMDEVDARLDEQDEKVEMLNGSDVVVGVLPVSGETNKIYRVPNDPTAGKYTDYGWNGTQFVPLCTYPNDVDDEPTAGSDNLVKSGGIKDCLDTKIDINSINLFNPNAEDFVSNKYLNTDGSLSDASTLSTSGFIPVKSSTQYSTAGTSLRMVVAFGSDRQPLDPLNFLVQNANTFTTPSDCKYVRATVQNALLSQTQIAEGAQQAYHEYDPLSGYGVLKKTDVINDLTSTSTEKPLAAAQGKALSAKIDNETESIDNKKVDINSINLFNPDDEDVVLSAYVEKNGDITHVQSGSLNTSGFIPVEPSTQYSTAYSITFRLAVAYDENKQPLDPTTYLAENAYTFTTPSNCKYVRVTFFSANYEYAQIAKGESQQYTPYNPLSGYGFLSADDVVNDLTTNNPSKALSAAQGKALKDMIDGISGENILTGKTVYAYGDSITYGADNGGVSYIDKIATRNQMVLTKMATSGSTWVKTGTRGCIYQAIKSCLPTVGASGSILPAPDYLVISGGYNDAWSDANKPLSPLGTFVLPTDTHPDTNPYGERAFYNTFDETTFCGALEKALYYIKTFWTPSPKIVYVITYQIPGSPQWGGEYSTKLKQILDKWGVTYVDMTRNGSMICTPNNAVLNFWNNENLFAYAEGTQIQGIHPNDNGQERISRYVEAKMREIG